MNNIWLRSSVSALAFALGTAAAHAQPIEQVTVTGVRASVNSALAIKKDATQIQDSIVAEDIGKLPDTTVVESLQHVTGVAILRNSYEPSTVLIRGLPDVQTLLNGRQIFTATGRAISLPDFPSELLDRVDVHKASSATDLEGGIAGLIDVHLHRPFDFSGFTMAGTAQLTYPTLATVPGEKASFLISDRWTTNIGEVGLLLDVSYNAAHYLQNNMGAEQRYVLSAGPVAGATLTPGPVCNNGAKCATTNLTYAGGIRAGYAALPRASLWQQDGKDERAALVLAGQWRPTKSVQTFAEMFYSRLRDNVNADYFVGQPNACDDYSRDKVFPGTNFVQESYAGCFAITSQQPRHTQENTWQIATGGNWYASDRLTLSTEWSTTLSRSANQNEVLDDYFNYNSRDGGHTIADYKGSGHSLIDMPGNEQINGPFYYSQLYDNWGDSRGSAWDGRLDANYDFGEGSFIRTLEVGYRYNRRAAHNIAPAGGGLGCAAITTNGNPAAANNQYIVDAFNSPACTAFRAQTTPSPAAAANPLAYTDIRVGGLVIPASDLHCTHGDLFGAEFGMTKFCDASIDYLWKNPEDVRNKFGYSGRPVASPANSYNISEASNDGYVKLDYAFPVFGFPVDGNLGARFVDTVLTVDSNSSKYVPNGQTNCLTCVVFTPVHAVKESTDLLPSINMRATLDEGLFWRFGASKTVTRPTFSQLNPNLVLRAPTGNVAGSISGGNPNLSSVKSVNLDTDAEYYWGQGNHLSLALFHRDVSGYIQNQTTQVFVDGQPYNQTLPTNYTNSSLEGVEAGYSQFLDFLPGFWSGFGWDINGTYLSGVFQNISHWHSNVTGIYERGPYSLRVSWTWSSKYLEGTTPGAQPNGRYVAPRNNVDASFNYKLNDNLSLTLDATNIMNSHYRAFFWQPGDSVAVDQHLFGWGVSEFDRTISIGVRYRQ